ncbi:MAG: hypothetical protein ACK4PG_09680 [Acetobacteraceae bacterium]
MLIFPVILLCIAFFIGIVYRMESLGAVVYSLDPPLLNTMQSGVQRNISPWLWDDVIVPVLEQPAWLLPALLGAALFALGLWQQRGR